MVLFIQDTVLFSGNTVAPQLTATFFFSLADKKNIH